MPRKTKKETSNKPEVAVEDKSLLSSLTNYRSPKVILLVVLLIGFLVLVYYKKSWFIAATVDGQPITNFELLSKMNQQYRQQTLNQMVNEKIIQAEIRKNNINVSQSEINDKISQLEKNVGGPEALNNLLTQQGQTRGSLVSQMKIQLAIEKLYAQNATVSAQEVSEFVEQNKEMLQATESAKQTKEAEEILKQQKLAKTFSQKFQELKEKAQVKIF